MASLLALLAAVLLVGAWHERSAGNRRDAALLAAFAVGTGFGAVAVVSLV